jgi:DNA-binding MarR family transcriptional regulator
MSEKLSINDINKLLKVYEILGHVDQEMPAGQIRFLLNVAKMEGASLRELAEASGAKMTTASRYLANLSAKDQFNQKGLNLVHAYENPANRRMKVVQLTKEGEKLLHSIIGK